MAEPDPDRPAARGGGSPALSDRVYQQIYARISANEWPRGTRLPTEVELAEQFGVSRTVLREALLRLRIDGLIASRQGAGTHVVGAPSERVIAFAEPESVADLQRCYEFRVGIEGEAAAVAAANHQRHRIGEIERAHEAMAACIARNGLGAEEDIAFHLAVARATENDYFLRTIASATRAIRVGMAIAATLSNRPPGLRLRTAFDEHGGILEAIRHADPDLARQRMRAHIESARRRVFVGQG